MCVEGILRLFTNFYLHRKFSKFLQNNCDCKAVEAPDIFDKLLWLSGCCVEGILRLFTNFYLYRKVLIFLRNDSACKDVDLYITRKIYAVIESLDLMRNISWLASCFSKIKKPNKHCSGNQRVIAGICILAQFPIFILNSLSAMDGRDCPLSNQLRSTVVSCQIFIRSQSLIARWTHNDFSLPAVACNFYEACCINDVSRGSRSYLFCTS